MKKIVYMLPGIISAGNDQVEEDALWRRNNGMFQKHTLGPYYMNSNYYYKIVLKATDRQATLIGLKYKVLTVDKV